MRLLHKALVREMTANGTVAFAALSAIALALLLVRMLGQAAMGRIDEAALLPFIAFAYLRMMPVLLSLALFIGVLITLGRAWQDSEMVIWACAGVSPSRLLRPILVFALPLTALIATLTLGILPWAAERHAHYERQLAVQRELTSLAPGVFVEQSGGRRAFFVESLIESGPQVENIFIQSEENGRSGIVVARRGQLARSERGTPYLVLEQGRRYEGVPGEADYRVVEFERYRFRLESGQPSPLYVHARMLTSAQLLRDPSPRHQAEWVGRLSYPISALLLAFMALPLSLSSPRSGRALSILTAVLAYTVYNNLFSLSQSWVAQGRLTGTEALLLVHSGALLAFMGLFVWRFYPLQMRWKTA